MISNDQILTLGEAAEFLRISAPTLYRKARSGKIPAQKVGRAWRFLKDQLEEYLRRGKLEVSAKIKDLPIDLNSITDLCKKYSIGLCYLFGSYSNKTADEHSDVDIGIVFLPNVDIDVMRRSYDQIKDEFAAAVQGHELDFIFLQEVGPMVSESAVEGEIIYCVDENFKGEYEDRVLTKAMDFKFFQSHFDREMLEEVKKGGFFVA